MTLTEGMTDMKIALNKEKAERKQENEMLGNKIESEWRKDSGRTDRRERWCSVAEDRESGCLEQCCQHGIWSLFQDLCPSSALGFPVAGWMGSMKN